MKHLLILVLTFMGCTSATVDLEEERKIIIQQLIDAPNQSLIEKDVEGAVSAVPEVGDVFIANGDIFKRTKDEQREHMKNEISTVEYLKFTHISDPEIKFIDNGHACYGTAQIKIDYALISDSNRVKREFVYSILFVGEKQSGKWVMSAFSQSDKTQDPDVLMDHLDVE